MVHASLVDELVLAPSASWATLVRRHNLVSEYLRISRPTTDDVNVLASQAGISPRMSYRVVRQYRERLQGAFPPTKIVGRGKPLCRNQEAAIAEAIRIAGSGATTKEVVEAVRNISASLGVRSPSEYAIIDRLRCGRDLAGLNERLQYGFDWIIDACASDLEIDCGDGQFETASIVGLINLRSGKIEGHCLYTGVLGAVDLTDVIGTKWSNLQASAAVPDELAGTRVVCKQLADAIAPLSAKAVTFASCPRNTIRSGGALRSILGRKLGGIRLLSRQRARAEINRSVGVFPNIARTVVAHLIEQWNRNS